MGLVSKLRGELVDIIEWVDSTRNTLVWRFPRYQNEIKNGARLVVRPGQSAIFVDRGRIADVLLRSIVVSEFSEAVSSTEISIVDLASNYARISEEVRRAVLGRIDQEYGLDVPTLIIVNISVPEQVERALDARSSMGVLGDLNRYQQYQLGESIPTAAANPAGGLAGAGVGLGMGIAIAGAGAPSKSPLPLIPPTPEADPALWHVASGGRTFGPYTVAQLAQAVAAGEVTSESLVWTVGMVAWTPMARVSRLAVLFPPPPPA